MDKLDAEIEKAKKDVADLKRKVETRETELRALIKAAELRPAQAAEAKSSPAGSPATTEGAGYHFPPGTIITVDDSAVRRGGRQPGAISKPWRAVLAGIYRSKNRPLDIEAISLLAEGAGLDLQAGSVLARMKNYVELGYVEEVNGQYRVTAAAAEKFELEPQKE